MRKLLENREKNEEFKRVFLEALDEGLGVLGETTKETLLYLLKQNYQIEEKEIPDNLERFISGLREIFGESGSSFLESQIIKVLYRKLGFIIQVNMNLREAVKNARRLYL